MEWKTSGLIKIKVEPLKVVEVVGEDAAVVAASG